MRIGKICLISILGAGLIFTAIPNLCADETSEAILKLLIKKGIITQREVDAIKAEVAKEKPKVPKSVEERVVQLEKKLPAWIEDMKLKGDFRLRYQWTDNADAEDQHRGRYRFRLGLESKINEMLKVAAGLASGSSDPRSTNQTMTNNFDTPDIRLDYVYAKYAPTDWLTLEGGKLEPVKKLIFSPSDLLWDSDIHPDGGVIQLKTSLDEYDLDLFMNNAVWVLDEASSDESDPVMFVVQPGFKKKFGDAHLKVGVAGYIFNGVKGSLLENSSGSNTVDENNLLQFNYSSISPSLEFGVEHPFNDLVPYVAFFGDYIYNPAPETENDGYLLGLKVGDKKVKGAHDWQFKYMYRWLEQDAWLDIFPDADVLSGVTDVESHELIFNYGLSDNTFVGLDYYYTERAEADDRNDILQVDWNIKF